jgi:hypothetical protein
MGTRDWDKIIFILGGIITVGVLYKLMQVLIGRCRTNARDNNSEMGDHPFHLQQRPLADPKIPYGSTEGNLEGPSQPNFRPYQQHSRKSSDTGRGLASAGDSSV